MKKMLDAANSKYKKAGKYAKRSLNSNGGYAVDAVGYAFIGLAYGTVGASMGLVNDLVVTGANAFSRARDTAINPTWENAGLTLLETTLAVLPFLKASHVINAQNFAKKEMSNSIAFAKSMIPKNTGARGAPGYIALGGRKAPSAQARALARRDAQHAALGGERTFALPSSAGRHVEKSAFDREVSHFAANVESNNFALWKEGMIGKGFRKDTIGDIVEHGSIAKGRNPFSRKADQSDGWKKYFEEISNTQIPINRIEMDLPHAHHLVQKGIPAAAKGSGVLQQNSIHPFLSRHNLGWAPNIKGQHGAIPQGELLPHLNSSNNRSEVITTLQRWLRVSQSRRR